MTDAITHLALAAAGAFAIGAWIGCATCALWWWNGHTVTWVAFAEIVALAGLLVMLAAEIVYCAQSI